MPLWLGEEMSVTIYTHLETDMGERVHAQKCLKLMGEKACLVDIAAHIGERYEELAALNLALAEAGHAPIKPAGMKEEMAIALTWTAGLSALYGYGITPHVAKLYAHQSNEVVLSPLYNDVELIVTESLLGSERARAYGLDQVLYLPHHFTHTTAPRRVSEKIIIGCVARLEYWKNVEFVLEAARLLAQKHDILLVLKGDFPQRALYPEYDAHLAEKLRLYQDEPWLKWDRSFTPYPEVLEEYATFDFCIQPSGAEGASNTVVELMGLGKPVIVLDTSSHPYLFKGGALFAKAKAQVISTQLSFYEPDLDSLVEQAERLLDPRERALWARRAQKVANARFHPSIAKSRLHGMLSKTYDQATLNRLYDQDRALYRL